MAWVSVMTNGMYDVLASEQPEKRASLLAAVPVNGAVKAEAMQIAQSLALSIPAATWNIEVDLLGHWRITVYFKGIDISASATELG